MTGLEVYLRSVREHGAWNGGFIGCFCVIRAMFRWLYRAGLRVHPSEKLQIASPFPVASSAPSIQSHMREYTIGREALGW